MGLACAVAGVLFVALIGRKLLPSHSTGVSKKQRSQRNLRTLYGLQ